MIQKKLENNIQTSNLNELHELAGALIIASQRTLCDLKHEKNIVNDILKEFKHLNIKQIIEAIKRGGLGYYGNCYKLSTTQICVWIREYEREIKNSGSPLQKPTEILRHW